MKVVILAGGLGTRISEYTKTIPKPMIKINKKPIRDDYMIKDTKMIIMKNKFAQKTDALRLARRKSLSHSRGVKQKYLKYKLKYLKLKRELNL